MQIRLALIVVVLLTGHSALAVVGGVQVQVAAVGDPLPGSTVVLKLGDEVVAEDETDATGIVRFPVEEGDYIVEVTSSDGTTQSQITVDPNAFDSFIADPSKQTVEQLDDPLPTLVTPPDAKTESGYDLGYRADNGVITINVATPFGPVYVSAPELSEPNTITTWGVLPSPVLSDPKAAKKNQREMERHSVSIDEQTVVLSNEGYLSVQSATRVVLVVSRNKKTVAMGTIRLQVVETNDSVLVERREQGVQMIMAGSGMTHYGAYDGDPMNTAIMIGSESTRVAAESTLGVSFYTPGSLRGLSEASIMEADMSFQAPFRSVGLEFYADKYDLLRGESTMSHVTLLGLGGITGPAFLGLVNNDPGIITYMPQNTQLITLQPSDVAADGTVKFDRGLVGISRGNFRVTAILMVP